MGANGPQNDKIVAVWNTLEPLPLSVTDPWIIGLGYLVFGVALAYTYWAFSVGWPAGLRVRGWYMTVILLLMYMFWEFSTPINLFSEPLPLVAIDVAFWAIMAFSTGYALVWAAHTNRLTDR